MWEALGQGTIRDELREAETLLGRLGASGQISAEPLSGSCLQKLSIPKWL